MSLYTKQKVTNVHMHLDGRDAGFEVRPVTGSTGVVSVRMTNWENHSGHQFELYASDEQLEALECELSSYLMEREMEKHSDPNVTVNRSEKVTA